MFIEHLLCTKHRSKYFKHINSHSPHSNSTTNTLIIPTLQMEELTQRG